MTSNHDHWNDHAQQWQQVGPPLRPAPADVRLAEALVAEVLKTANCLPLQAILLGVTPELALMRWPQGVKLLAIDRCPGMIQSVWPHDCMELHATAVCSDWRMIPVSDAAAHVVIGDGCFTTLDSPEGYLSVSAEVRRVLKPGGRFIMRFFLRPNQPESCTSLFAELKKGCIGNFHIFKWRLAMSLHGSLDKGVRVGDIWEVWHAEGLDEVALSKKLNWPQAVIASINAYKGIDTRYTFPTLEELRSILENTFCELACFFPDYELGDRCPTFLLAPRD